MKFFIKTLLRVCINQTRNLVKLFTRHPLTYPSLGSMTLDDDDVVLAREWLNDTARWNDESEVRNYEKEFAAWNGSQFAFSFMGGRVALSACIYALALREGDEVIIPGYTCVVVPNAFAYAGVKVVYSDIELDTYGLDSKAIEEKITPMTKAILIHHLYGLVCRDYDKILEISHRHNLKVIEDCAHSTGAEYQGKKVGTRGDVAFYSSEQSKVFNTVQGGLAVTDDSVFADRLREYQLQSPIPDSARTTKILYSVILNYFQFKHSMRWLLSDLAELRYGKYRIVSTTVEEENGICPSFYRQRMPAPIAALGRNQLKKIDDYNRQRRCAAARWYDWVVEHDYQAPLVIDGSQPVYLRYPVRVAAEKKRNLSWAKNQLGVYPGVWFVSHIHPVTKEIKDCPNARQAVETCINLPTLGI